MKNGGTERGMQYHATDNGQAAETDKVLAENRRFLRNFGLNPSLTGWIMAVVQLLVFFQSAGSSPLKTFWSSVRRSVVVPGGVTDFPQQLKTNNNTADGPPGFIPPAKNSPSVRPLSMRLFVPG
uniref:Uncharacterized protein n=1 Tax=Globodera rostochiensis TaxID=31243 RepID=A0A914H091_GLORO